MLPARDVAESDTNMQGRDCATEQMINFSKSRLIDSRLAIEYLDVDRVCSKFHSCLTTAGPTQSKTYLRQRWCRQSFSKFGDFVEAVLVGDDLNATSVLGAEARITFSVGIGHRHGRRKETPGTKRKRQLRVAAVHSLGDGIHTCRVVEKSIE